MNIKNGVKGFWDGLKGTGYQQPVEVDMQVVNALTKMKDDITKFINTQEVQSDLSSFSPLFAAKKAAGLFVGAFDKFTTQPEETIQEENAQPEHFDIRYAVNSYNGFNFGDTGNGLHFGLYNTATGQGTQNDPNFSQGRRDAPFLSFGVLDIYYRTSWLAQRMVDLVPDEVCGTWRKFKHEDLELVEAREKAELKLCIQTTFKEAMRWGRLYGGAAIVYGIKGEAIEQLSKPLRYMDIKQGSIEFFNVVIKDQSNPFSILHLDPFEKGYLKADKYMIVSTHGASCIHSSRMIFFYGKKLPIYSAMKQLLWGDSILTTVLGLIDIVEAMWCNISGLVQKANVDVIALDNYMQLLQNQPEQVLGAMGFSKKILSNFNTMLIDAKDKYERKELGSLAGLAELLTEFLQMLSGSQGAPLTKFLGTSIGGFSSGDNETLQWSEKIRADRENHRNQLQTLDKIIEMHCFGKLVGIEYEFDATIQESPTQKSARELNDSTRDNAYLDMGIITKKDIASNLKNNNIYPTLDLDAIDDLSDTTDQDPYSNTIDKNENPIPMPSEQPLQGNNPPQMQPTDSVPDVT